MGSTPAAARSSSSDRHGDLRCRRRGCRGTATEGGTPPAGAPARRSARPVPAATEAHCAVRRQHVGQAGDPPCAERNTARNAAQLKCAHGSRRQDPCVGQRYSCHRRRQGPGRTDRTAEFLLLMCENPQRKPDRLRGVALNAREPAAQTGPPARCCVERNPERPADPGDAAQGEPRRVRSPVRGPPRRPPPRRPEDRRRAG
jgi:hypothetical protein